MACTTVARMTKMLRGKLNIHRRNSDELQGQPAHEPIRYPQRQAFHRQQAGGIFRRSRPGGGAGNRPPRPQLGGPALHADRAGRRPRAGIHDQGLCGPPRCDAGAAPAGTGCRAADVRALRHHQLPGRGEELSGGRQKKALLANALEALIAALYLDGGLDPVRAFVVRQIVGDALPSDQPGQLTDYKSALQEMAQALKLPQPRYAIVEEHGPEHAKTFLVEVRVGKDWVSRAEGLSKKSA